MSRVSPWVILFLTCWALAGCGDGRPKRVAVAGKVTIDGAPLTNGFIQVIPEKDRPATSKIDANGGFQLTTYDTNDGCVLGRHRVAVIANETLSAQEQKWHAPKKYADPESSGLTVEITKPTETVLIDLTWNGAKPFVEKFGKE